MKRVVRVVVADGDVLLRNLVRRVCAPPDLRVVAETSSLRDLVQLCQAERPDVALCDVQFADGALRDGIAEILATGAKVLVLTADPSPERLTDLVSLGASGYLLHDAPPEHLPEAVVTVARGHIALHPAAASTIVQQWRWLRSEGAHPTMGPRGAARSALTPRESEVLEAMSDGLSTKAIARQLGVAVKTIENHKIRIFDKLGVRSHAQAVSMAIGHALLTPSSPEPIGDMSTTP